MFARWHGSRDGTRRVADSGDLVHVVVHDAVSSMGAGRIVCSLPSKMTASQQHAVVCDWTLPHGFLPSDVDMDASGLCIRKAPVGDYTLRIQFENGNVVETHTQVHAIPLPTVMSYKVVNASTGTSRDGAVFAVVEDAPAKCTYLWSNGVCTKTPELQGATVGMYAVSIVGTPSCNAAQPCWVRARGVDQNG